MPVTETLELDLSGALGSIGELDSALSEVGSSLQSALEEALSPLSNIDPIEITADTSAAEAEISGLEAQPIDVPVDADTSLGEASIADFDALAESLAPTVPVDADTSAAEASIGDLEALADSAMFSAEFNLDTGNAEAEVQGLEDSVSSLGGEAQGATGGMDALGSSVSSSGSFAGLAQGNMSGLEGAIGGVASKAGPAGVAIAGTAGALGILVTAGIDAEGAAQRFTATFGNMAGAIQTINVGNLNADLNELAISLGTDDEALMQAAATMFQFARNAGVAAPEAEKFTEQVVALASRAVALNPALGSVADVIPLMSRGLATGGRFAQRFGLDLTTAEIASRALANTGKTLASELTITEKQMAGAQLAAEKYGGSLKGDIATGTENAVIQQRRLTEEVQNFIEAAGRPLVAPFFDLMKNLQPVVETLSHILASQLGPSLVLVSSVLELLGPPLELVNSLMDALGPVVLALAGPLGIAALAATGLVAAMGPLGAAFDAVVGAVSDLGSAIGGGILSAFDAIGAAVENVVGFFQDLMDALGPVGDVLSVLLAGGAPIIGMFTGMAAAVQALIGPIKKLLDAFGGIVDFGSSIGDFFTGTTPAAKSLSDVISQLSDSERVLYIATGQLPPILQAQANALHDNAGASNEAAGAHERHATAAQTNAGALAVMNSLVDATTAKLGEAKTALDLQALAWASQKAPLDAFGAALDGAISKLPTVGSLLQQAAADVQKLTGALDPTLVTAHLRAIWTTFNQFFTDVQSIAEQGFQGVATALLEIGPEAGAALASMFTGATDQQRADLEALVVGVQQGMFRIQLELEVAKERVGVVAAAIGKGIGDELLAAFGATDFSQLSTIPVDILNAAAANIEAANAIPGVFGRMALAASDSWGAGLLGIPVAAKAAVDGAGAATEGSDLPAKTGEIGKRSADEFESAIDHVPTAAERAWVLATGTARNNVGPATEGGKAVGEGTKHGHEQGLAGMELDAQIAAGKAIAAAVAEGTRGTGLMAEAGRALSRGFTNGITEGGVAAGAAGLALVTAVEAGTRNTGLMALSGQALAAAFTAAVQAAAALANAAGLALVTAVEAGTRNTGLMAASGLALTTAFVASIQAAAGLANMAGLALATAAALGTRNTGLMAEAGSALGAALASSLQAQTGAANAAGLALVTAAAQGTRNTGLMAEAGNALGSAFVDAVRGHAGAANNAGGDLASGAASGARGSEGAMSSAGSSAGAAFVSGVASQSGAAFAAGQKLGAAAAAGAKSAGSPTEHLFTDLADSLADAFAGQLQNRANELMAQNAGKALGQAAASGFDASGPIEGVGPTASDWSKWIEAGGWVPNGSGGFRPPTAAEWESFHSDEISATPFIQQWNKDLRNADTGGAKDYGQAMGQAAGKSFAQGFTGEVNSQAIFSMVNADVASRLGAKGITPPTGMTLGSLNINVDARGATDPQAIATATGAEVEARIRGLIRAGR